MHRRFYGLIIPSGDRAAPQRRENPLTVARAVRWRASIDPLTQRDAPTGGVPGRAQRPVRVEGRQARDRADRATARVLRRRRFGALAIVALLLAVGIYSAGVGRSNNSVRASPGSVAAAGHANAASGRHPVPAPARPVAHLVVTVPGRARTGWSVVAKVRGKPAAWLAQRSGVALMRFDQHLVHLTLHAGSSDGGSTGWTYGDQITPREVHLLVAAFNGGFKLTYGDVGFVAGGHVAVAAQARARLDRHLHRRHDQHRGLAGTACRAQRKTVFSVLQNQQLLVDRGVAPASVATCIITCWGETIGSRTVGRSLGRRGSPRRAARVGRRRAAPAGELADRADRRRRRARDRARHQPRLGRRLPLRPSSRRPVRRAGRSRPARDRRRAARTRTAATSWRSSRTEQASWT